MLFSVIRIEVHMISYPCASVLCHNTIDIETHILLVLFAI